MDPQDVTVTGQGIAAYSCDGTNDYLNTKPGKTYLRPLHLGLTTLRITRVEKGEELCSHRVL